MWSETHGIFFNFCVILFDKKEFSVEMNQENKTWIFSMSKKKKKNLFDKISDKIFHQNFWIYKFSIQNENKNYI